MAQQRPTRISTPHVLPRGSPGLVMGPCIVEIDRIVIRIVQYQLEVNRCRNEEIIVKGNFVCVRPIWVGHPRVGNWDMHKVNRCRNEEVIVKGNFGWLRLTVLSCIVEIDRIVIREFQYQFEVNRCRNEEIIVKGIFGGCGLCGRGAPALVMGPCIVEIDRIDIREVQYQFEVNLCRNEEVNFQGSSAYIARTDRQTDRQTDGRHR
ncbi:hypothetical protein DPMN_023436 [Dreissena polymorpha]|uniref:Uncharacterized protein n=1 Tax=Dreissena polymorpha TaxID=45954 RepID=A0A9D4RBS6_DREPO|nr:hypothetical protein DPMN_023436 [Dreissena polymorpha]